MEWCLRATLKKLEGFCDGGFGCLIIKNVELCIPVTNSGAVVPLLPQNYRNLSLA